MGDLRTPARVEEILAEVRKTEDPKQALRLLAQLAGKPVYEEKKRVTHFSEQAGITKRREWADADVWDGKLVSWEWGINEARTQAMMALVPQYEALLIHGDGHLVAVTILPECRCSEGTTPAMLRFQIAREL